MCSSLLIYSNKESNVCVLFYSFTQTKKVMHVFYFTHLLTGYLNLMLFVTWIVKMNDIKFCFKKAIRKVSISCNDILNICYVTV